MRLRRTFFHWVAGIWSASKARRTSSPAICPSALPRSMSAITDSESAISGGSVRDVLADTNNLSERWKRLPTPAGWCWTGADDHRLGMGRGRGQGPGSCTAPARAAVFPPSAITSLGHRLTSRSVTPNSSWPESHPDCHDAGHTVVHAGRTRPDAVVRGRRGCCGAGPRRARVRRPGVERVAHAGGAGPPPGLRREVPPPDGVPGTSGASAPPPTPSAARASTSRAAVRPRVSARAGRGPRARPPDAPSGAGAWRSRHRSRPRRRGPRRSARGARRTPRRGGHRR